LDPHDYGAAVSGLLLESGLEPGHKYLWLRADHIVLAAEQPRAISARNILKGEIARIQAEAGGSRLVELLTPVGPILSRVTQDAVTELGLAEGGAAWALVKAHALQH